MPSKAYVRKRKHLAGQNIIELGCLVFFISAGVVFAVHLWRHWGVLGAIIGFPLGSGAVFGLVAGSQALRDWWLPDYPPCLCGQGGGDDYRFERWSMDEREFLCVCEHCGRSYLRGNRRFSEVTPDSVVRPYMRHAPFGRWKPAREREETRLQ